MATPCAYTNDQKVMFPTWPQLTYDISSWLVTGKPTDVSDTLYSDSRRHFELQHNIPLW